MSITLGRITTKQALNKKEGYITSKRNNIALALIRAVN